MTVQKRESAACNHSFIQTRWIWNWRIATIFTSIKYNGTEQLLLCLVSTNYLVPSNWSPVEQSCWKNNEATFKSSLIPFMTLSQQRRVWLWVRGILSEFDRANVCVHTASSRTSRSGHGKTSAARREDCQEMPCIHLQGIRLGQTAISRKTLFTGIKLLVEEMA